VTTVIDAIGGPGMNLILDRVHTCPYTAVMGDHAADLLRRQGIQVTAQRLAVLAAVSGRPHCTADDVVKAVRAEIGVISRQAVYDTLGVLADKGLIRRIQPAGSPARYENRTGDNHHHLICRTCGRTVDVDCAVGAAPCLTPGDDSGFEIDEAEVIYWGRCPECLGRTPAPSRTQEETGRVPRVPHTSKNGDTDRARPHRRTDQR
jgi:Fur family transcriptional regulator, stress-responsive regulator